MRVARIILFASARLRGDLFSHYDTLTCAKRPRIFAVVIHSEKGSDVDFAKFAMLARGESLSRRGTEKLNYSRQGPPFRRRENTRDMLTDNERLTATTGLKAGGVRER